MFSRHLDTGPAEAASQVPVSVGGFEPHSCFYFLFPPALLLLIFVLSIESLVPSLYHLLFFSFYRTVFIYASFLILQLLNDYSIAKVFLYNHFQRALFDPLLLELHPVPLC